MTPDSAKPATTLAIGHRGAAAEFPENTLRSFERAFSLGADGVELDARVTRDGTAVVLHDPDLRRLAGDRRTIRSCRLADLRKVRVRGERIPTLTEALNLATCRASVLLAAPKSDEGGQTPHGRPRTTVDAPPIVQIEVKPGVPLPPVLRAIRSARATDNVIIASFSASIVRAAAALAPKIPRMLIADRPKRRLAPARSAMEYVRSVTRVGASGLSVDHRAITDPKFVKTLHAHALTLWCWTVNDPARMRELSTWGVDAILSDDPKLLIETLRCTSVPP